MMDDTDERENQLLEGWQAIANFSGYTKEHLRFLRTHRGLPVYRRPHGKKTRIWAYKDEVRSFLEAYQCIETDSPEAAEPPPTPPHLPPEDDRIPWWILLWFLISVVLMVWALWLLFFGG